MSTYSYHFFASLFSMQIVEKYKKISSTTSRHVSLRDDWLCCFCIRLCLSIWIHPLSFSWTIPSKQMLIYIFLYLLIIPFWILLNKEKFSPSDRSTCLSELLSHSERMWGTWIPRIPSSKWNFKSSCSRCSQHQRWQKRNVPVVFI